MDSSQQINTQTFYTILQVFATLVAAIAAISAWYTVDKTHKNTQAQLIKSLLDEYGASEMLKAVRGLLEKWDLYGVEYTTEFLKQRNQKNKEWYEWDDWRRRIITYFHKVVILYQDGLLDKKYARQLANKDQLRFLREKIEPLEAVVNPEYAREVFNTLESLYKDLE